MSTSEKKERTAPSVVAALSRLAGVHAAAFGLAVTYLIAVLGGCTAPTALLRAMVAGAVFLVLGRCVGAFAAHHLIPPPAPAPSPASGPEARS